MRADLLAETIARLDEALAAACAFDGALVAGLLRLQPAQAGAERRAPWVACRTMTTENEGLTVDAESLPAAIRLPEGSWWDWEVIAWNPVEFRLAAGHDLTYSHGLELVFGEPAFVSCPAMFQDPVFRAPTADEVRSVADRFGEHPAVLVAFEADGGGREPVPCLIAAQRLQVVHERVPRPRHDDAAPGQRFAESSRRRTTAPETGLR